MLFEKNHDVCNRLNIVSKALTILVNGIFITTIFCKITKHNCNLGKRYRLL